MIADSLLVRPKAKLVAFGTPWTAFSSRAEMRRHHFTGAVDAHQRPREF